MSLISIRILRSECPTTGQASIHNARSSDYFWWARTNITSHSKHQMFTDNVPMLFPIHAQWLRLIIGTYQGNLMMPAKINNTLLIKILAWTPAPNIMSIQYRVCVFQGCVITCTYRPDSNSYTLSLDYIWSAQIHLITNFRLITCSNQGLLSFAQTATEPPSASHQFVFIVNLQLQSLCHKI